MFAFQSGVSAGPANPAKGFPAMDAKAIRDLFDYAKRTKGFDATAFFDGLESVNLKTAKARELDRTFQESKEKMDAEKLRMEKAASERLAAWAALDNARRDFMTTYKGLEDIIASLTATSTEEAEAPKAEKTGKTRGRRKSSDFDLTKPILDWMPGKGKRSAEEIAVGIGLANAKEVAPTLKTLVAAGKLQKSGAARGTRYEL